MKIRDPEKWIVVKHEDRDGVERTKFVGYISSATPDGKGSLNVKTRGPEQLIVEHPLPYSAPMADRGSDTEAFEFWWKQLLFVFELPDPRSFPALPAFPAEKRETLERYIAIAEELAQSRVINAVDDGFTIYIDDDTDETKELLARLPTKEIQTGFAAQLRQLDNRDEKASFGKAADALWLAAQETSDARQSERLEQLKAWRRAIGQLHGKSVNQLLRNKLVDDHGFAVLAYDEPHSPEYLLSAYGYGDLIHWGDKRGVVAAFEEDELSATETRSGFLRGAMGLSHMHMGFAVLARTAVGD